MTITTEALLLARKALTDAMRAAHNNVMWRPNQAKATEAVLAIGAALAQQPAASVDPDMRHPKIQALIGAKARREIELRLVEQLLDDPGCELSAMDMEYWYDLHDKLRDKLKAANREPVALSDERIDAIADLIVKGMPGGIQGFLNYWGWRQFSRALLEDCAGHYRAPALVAHEAWQALAETANRTLERAERRAARNAAIEPAAWFCEWINADGSPEWHQYHDHTDSLPADDEWEDRPPDRVTPLYATAQPAPAQVPQPCPCFPGACRGGEVINGRLANGQVCAAAAAGGA